MQENEKKPEVVKPELDFVTQLSVVVRNGEKLEPLVITIMRDKVGAYKLYFDVLSKNVLQPDKTENR